MRVCVIGCGAVGSLFAANLSPLDDVEAWAFDLDACSGRDQKAGSGCRRRRGGGTPGGDDQRLGLPPCDFGSSRRKRCTTSWAVAATAHAFADGRRRPVMNGVGDEETIADHVERVIRGTTFPAGKLLEPGVVQWDVKGDTTFGPFEPRPLPLPGRSSALADACTRAGMPAAAVADARPAGGER